MKRQDIRSNLEYDAGDKGIYRHYMQKEIYEQPNAIKNTCPAHRHGQVDFKRAGTERRRTAVEDSILRSSPVVFLITPVWFPVTGLEYTGHYPCDVEIASEFRYRKSACVVTA
ncbi:hypothetical protein ACLB1E_05745 [Escherichia coli]